MSQTLGASGQAHHSAGVTKERFNRTPSQVTTLFPCMDVLAMGIIFQEILCGTWCKGMLRNFERVAQGAR